MRRMLAMLAMLGVIAVVLCASASPAAAKDWQQWVGLHCEGTEVDRCAWVDVDYASGQVRARGNTRDEPDGGDYSVAVNDTMVQVLPFGGPWTEISGTRSGDFDGWHAVWDISVSQTAGVWCGFQYRALTYHRWTGASAGGAWIASDPVTLC